ncbi:DUF1223 domain-containing protein [Mesorhizobium sp. ZMM04-5]|uniref:DUF1223 domain-containing protein n=1 Tax=Mesorhizobium marinum TaxID=3228790 RepID=A0ABV3R537_9HYPH
MLLRSVAALAVSLAVAGPAASGERAVNVVELFTSQGCSSCPPANANLIRLRGRPDVLPLSFSVTYWDRLGWKDVFGQEKFTERQRVYEPALGERGPFTPQMVINGRVSIVGNHQPEVEDTLAAADPGQVPAIAIGARTVGVGAGAKGRLADVWVALYEPDVIEVAVKRGENTGRTLPHANVVRELFRVGTWNGAAAEFPRPKAASGLKTAVLVQEPDGGPILSAATD